MNNLKTRQELIILMNEFSQLIQSGSEKEQEDMFEALTNGILDPEWSNYIFHSDKYCSEHGGIMVEAVVDKILSYKPIIL